jgi:dihydrodipicolinate synthase/N-acetylneuraminate lyase
MLQNQPKPIGAGLTPEEVAEVANAVPEIRYVKEETAPCGQHLTRIKARPTVRLRRSSAAPAAVTSPMS